MRGSLTPWALDGVQTRVHETHHQKPARLCKRAHVLHVAPIGYNHLPPKNRGQALQHDDNVDIGMRIALHWLNGDE